jgi:hypothetical protein
MSGFESAHENSARAVEGPAKLVEGFVHRHQQ